jgi:hypothetical protein
MNTGLTPTTDELLDVGGPLWVSLVEEMRRLNPGPGDEVSVGEPWRVRVPSALMRARADGSMPRWELRGGVWVEQPDPAFA